MITIQQKLFRLLISCVFLEMIKSGVLPSFSSPTIWEKSSTFYTCIASRRLSLSDQQWTPDEHLDVIKIVRFSSKALWPFYVLWSRGTAGVAKTAWSVTFQHFCVGTKLEDILDLIDLSSFKNALQIKITEGKYSREGPRRSRKERLPELTPFPFLDLCKILKSFIFLH